MPLRRKFLALVMFWAAISVGGAFLFLRPWLLKGYLTVEETLLQRDVESLRNAMDLRLAALVKYIRPFAAWDATYAYLHSWDDEGYLKKEYAASLLKAEGVDMLAFVRADGSAGKLVRVKDGDLLEVSANPDEWKRLSPWIQNGVPEEDGASLRSFDGHPYAIVHARVMHSDGSGPPAGLLLIGARITSAIAADVDRIVRLNVTLEPDPGADVDSPSSPHPVVRPKGDVHEVSVPFLDEAGAPLFHLGFRAPRTVLAVGHRSGSIVLGLYLLSTFVLAVLLHIGLKVVIASRLETFRDEIDRVNIDRVGADVVLALKPDSHGDEISYLRERVAAAFARIAELEEARSRANARLVADSNLRQLGEMAGGIAHEINNPMTIVKGKCMRLLVQLDECPPDLEAAKKTIATIEATADRVAAIVRSMRMLARPGSGDPFVPVDLLTMIQSALALLEFRYSGRLNVVSVDGGMDIVVSCREVQIVQVIANLVSNALDAVNGREGARVTVRVETQAGVVRVVVSDNGDGPDSQSQARMFQPFFTTKAVGKGTGLGLAIARSIVLEHGGALSFERTEGETAFSLELPLAGSQLPIVAA